jgi:histidinol phosphatase-like enzyme (inositol monophosphatase family)
MTSQAPLADLVRFARELASAARNETVWRFNQGVNIENKGGEASFDPVTEADRAAEQVMRSLVAERFPDHGISGEEFSDKLGEGPYEWSLDPVDGTRSFICGLPTWTTLIALLEDGAPVLGLIDAPMLDETFVGSGTDAWLVVGDDKAMIRTSGCSALSETRLSTTDPWLFDENEFAAFDRLRRACRVTRYGHDAYGYARLAAGSLDLVVESGLKPHDYNALVPVVRGAGGHVGNWTGGSDLARGAIVAAASRALYDTVVELLAAA